MLVRRLDFSDRRPTLDVGPTPVPADRSERQSACVLVRLDPLERVTPTRGLDDEIDRERLTDGRAVRGTEGGNREVGRAVNSVFAEERATGNGDKAAEQDEAGESSHGRKRSRGRTEGRSPAKSHGTAAGEAKGYAGARAEQGA